MERYCFYQGGVILKPKTWKRQCEKQALFFPPTLPNALKHVRTEGKQLCVCAHGIVDLFLSDFYTKEMYYFCTFRICFYDLGDVFLVQMDVESVGCVERWADLPGPKRADAGFYSANNSELLLTFCFSSTNRIICS